MRLSNGVELRVVASDENHNSPVDICQQPEIGFLRRIDALEHENELLRRAACAIQLYLAGDDRSGSRRWLGAMVSLLSREH
jgi:hypothetical protein